jgi:hypothetical protein
LQGEAIARVRALWQSTLHAGGALRAARLPSPAAFRAEPSLLVGLASFAFAFTVAWWTGAPLDPPRDREPAQDVVPAAPPPTTIEATTIEPAPSEPTTIEPAAAEPAPRTVRAAWDVAQLLRSRDTTDTTKLALIEELAADPSEGATQALLVGAEDGSLLVSMASLRALTGRSCDAVAVAVARRLDDAAWQRRAWAARVLGANECAGTRRRLAQRLAVEADTRVKHQLQVALESLKEPGA